MIAMSWHFIVGDDAIAVFVQRFQVRDEGREFIAAQFSIAVFVEHGEYVIAHLCLVGFWQLREFIARQAAIVIGVQAFE